MGSISSARVGPGHSLQGGAEKRGIGAALHNKSKACPHLDLVGENMLEDWNMCRKILPSLP